MSAGSEALCRALCLADGDDPDERMTEHDARWRLYEPQAGAIQADPAPLLAALAEAGVLTRRTEVFNGYHCGHRETWMETQRDRVEWSDDGGMD